MSTVFGVLLAVHGLIHLVGLNRPNAVLWGTAAALFVAAAAALFLWPRWWWAVGAAAVAVSTIPIAQNWSEARVGAAVNAVILIGVIFGFLAQGPFSLRAQYDRDVRWGLDRPARADTLRDADLAGPAVPSPGGRHRSAARSEFPRQDAWPHPEWTGRAMGANRRRAGQCG